MSSIQFTACLPTFNVTNLPIPRIAPARVSPLCRTSLRFTTCPSTCQFPRLSNMSLKLTTSASSYQRHTPVCLYGGKEKSEKGNEASPWKALEKVMGSFKKEPSSVEDLLRQQIEKQEYFDDGGSGGSGSGGGGGFGGSEDEGADGIWNEVLQVILATVGFIFLYILIIDGEDIIRISLDFIKFIFGGKKSIRLSRLMSQWGMYYQNLTRKRQVQKDWLEREIVNTPTWFDSPKKYKRYFKSLADSDSD
ncbi:uncharacterized protein LOC132304539 [Cornus florida]|uniref:uncharacterized protein LOC132304539 n=1 Tax=Cornus florida TaxID=4283 RepID=UPI00289CF856|nr:uncharacterized protein LOC132304539 [Cornus florida]XP_059658265.1 uncharacterized protein LOC132304539 [Cornus florida]XP_059658274.1 uncharacterized protein LOC132304539 [Cornus florida]XP_059658283.1 uncharacterized protein LOC132304539 [Cornus florida]